MAFHIHNASAMPIYEVELPLPARHGEEQNTEFIGLVPPGQDRQASSTAGVAAVIRRAGARAD